MMPTIHSVRHSLLSRGTKYLTALMLVAGAVMVYLLSSASADTEFASDLRWLLLLGVGLVLALMMLVGNQLLALRRRFKAGLFGSKLTLRLVLLFALVAVLPGALVYAVSVQFLSKSIESWFDVRVDKALEGGLRLGRTTLDNMLRDVTAKAESMALSLPEVSPSRLVSVLNTRREQAAVQEATLFRADGSIVAFSVSEDARLNPTAMPPSAMRKIMLQQPHREIDSDSPEGLSLVVVVPVNVRSGDTWALQLVQRVPQELSRDAETVRAMYQEYQQLSNSRSGLKQLYGLSLTLSLLIALLSSLVLAILFSERLSAPLVLLAAGTRAVAQGDFSQRHPVRSHDELGVLTELFNAMTRQLDEARAAALGNQEQLEAANAYLGSILAKLSAGVLSFDSEQRLRSANPSASGILQVELQPLIGARLDEWPVRNAQLAEVAGAILAAMRAGGGGSDEQVWEKQLDMDAGHKVLLMRGSTLHGDSGAGFVVVFDDITRLLQAQRYAAWGEVARRLAHEIKNPLTPIQLSAERLEHRLAEKLQPAEAEMLARSTQTIVKQVAQLKGMVDAFSQYARMPEMQRQPIDLNLLVREVLSLYDAQRPRVALELQDGLPAVHGDPARLRQVIHNLLQNAQQAVVESSAARIWLRTEQEGSRVRLTVVDSGPGFAPEILARAFEPYVTTKLKGTGLGLAIVKKIVEEHNGSIELANRKGAGAQVSILLPVAIPGAQPERTQANAGVG